jgi:hypothetical protein
MTVVRVVAANGTTVQFVDQVMASGAMKDVYFSPGRDYVVAFFRGQPDDALRARLDAITGPYRERIMQQPGGQYWEKLFCWPTTVLEHNGRLGIVAPFYDSDFFFEHGSRNNDMLGIKGREKEGKWFASPSNRSRYLDPRELGDGMRQMRLCLMIARALRRMHAAGLAHSDLSYKNVLIDPTRGRACLIDIDGLVVPGKFAPDVVGTPDFIAPECVMTAHLGRDDPARKLPSIATDRHALAVLIYMYLLCRHPLRGDQIHDIDDPHRDEELAMGERALFVEHPQERANQIRLANVRPFDLPWRDTERLPYQLTGPYLSALFARAFIDALHAPGARPSADEWESALIKTVDLLLPCANQRCEQKWFVYDGTTRVRCPFCHTPAAGSVPILNLYSSRTEGAFRPENHRLVVYSNLSLFQWHIDRDVAPNERILDEQKRRVGYFVFHDQRWYLVNEAMPELTELANKSVIAIGARLALDDAMQLLTSKKPGGRLFVVQMVNI